MSIWQELTATEQALVWEVRERVSRLHQHLPDNGLVVWTAGNVSERVPGLDLMVIKPSGVLYSELSAQAMVVTDLFGNKIDCADGNEFQPSSDTFAHAYVYRHMPEVGGVVHTHSTYATAFAAVHEPIPVVLTMIADEFGGEIPIGPVAIIGDDSIGEGIVETLRESNSPAVLMGNHGPFTVGKDGLAAVKAAVMVEEVARTVAVAKQIGEPKLLPEDIVSRLYQRYQHVYGQN
ncbi:MAG: L-ribulose-5-phosphate 4-epimerase [Arcanobacterium sp.]|nr:L-ribulose-5-phosphate 4-epimerase [Arcanobacterium sp.]